MTMSFLKVIGSKPPSCRVVQRLVRSHVLVRRVVVIGYSGRYNPAEYYFLQRCNLRSPGDEYEVEDGRLNESERRLQELLVCALGGDAAAYERFLQALTGHLRAFLRKRLAGLPDDVEDLVQETLIAVHNQRHTYDPAQPVTAWLHAIAKYKLIDLLRRRSRHEAYNDPFDEEHEIFAARDDHAADARRDVMKLLEELPERQRVALTCMKLEGLSVVETAKRTGMSESAVKVTVHRALKTLAARMRTAS
ncbi:MAG: sigma-70 family RNA polymerase sigma factor [Rhodospirillaceae bacterium]